MMGLWGLKHVEERRQQLLYVNKKAVYQVGNKEYKSLPNLFELLTPLLPTGQDVEPSVGIEHQSRNPQAGQSEYRLSHAVHRCDG